MHIGILGAGAWGCALAKVLSDFSLSKHSITLYAHDKTVSDEINALHTNSVYFSGYSFNNSVIATNDLNDLINCDLILLTTPVKFIAETITQFKNTLNGKGFTRPFIICSKGLTFNANGEPVLISEVIINILNETNLMVLSGPSFASETAQGLKGGAMLLAAASCKKAEEIIKLLDFSTICVYPSKDVIGAQVGGAIKNVLAIACGISYGLKQGHNALASLISRGVEELTTLTVSLGGKYETAIGLSGLGDLVLTATSPESRNFSLGLEIAKTGGFNFNLQPNKKGIAEGYFSAYAVHKLATQRSLHLPICNAVYSVLYEKKNLPTVLNSLFNQPTP